MASSSLVTCIFTESYLPGFQPTLPLCLTPAITLLLFQLLSRLRITRNISSSPARPSAFGAFLSGATANALATAILYPLLLAKVRVQASRKQPGRTGAMSMTNIWEQALKTGGWAGLYQGLPAQLIKGFVNQGVTMLVKQRCVNFHLQGAQCVYSTSTCSIERAAVRLYAKAQ